MEIYGATTLSKPTKKLAGGALVGLSLPWKIYGTRINFPANFS